MNKITTDSLGGPFWFQSDIQKDLELINEIFANNKDKYLNIYIWVSTNSATPCYYVNGRRSFYPNEQLEKEIRELKSWKASLENIKFQEQRCIEGIKTSEEKIEKLSKEVEQGN